MSALLQTANLDIDIPGRTLVRQLDLTVGPGEFVCVLGTNGAGKTLTLHTLAGIREAPTGAIHIGGDALATLPRMEVARRLGLLLQLHDDAFPLSVIDTVLMGRFPRLGLWQWAGKDDLEIAHAALASFDLLGFADRSVLTLSGGERERVALATLQAQDPDIWLLDEPLNHLDPHHQIAVLKQLHATARRGRAVITTVHNPALAMRYADRALLLYGDGDWEFGSAAQLLEPRRLQRLYKTPFDYYTATAAGGTGHRVLLPS